MAFHTNNSITVRGKVTDNSGAPLAGVNVLAKGMQTATTTASNGSYTIVLGKTNSVLVFSALGYSTKEVKINGKTTINVKLQAVSKNL